MKDGISQRFEEEKNMVMFDEVTFLYRMPDDETESGILPNIPSALGLVKGWTLRRLTGHKSVSPTEVYTRVFALDVAARHCVQFQMPGTEAVAMLKGQG